ncbi:8444_t:CDS:2 [Cetraspora pellucida]|uniref:8444_t:CDS:1 n=1 Tax=Cetraspora pellucida TaxID=1433469 RepID=A0ACA9JWD5_9GLOM|nr:8444_t:CDS:2 [Cetraspora pellucida]
MFEVGDAKGIGKEDKEKAFYDCLSQAVYLLCVEKQFINKKKDTKVYKSCTDNESDFNNNDDDRKTIVSEKD